MFVIDSHIFINSIKLYNMHGFEEKRKHSVKA